MLYEWRRIYDVMAKHEWSAGIEMRESKAAETLTLPEDYKIRTRYTNCPHFKAFKLKKKGKH